MGFEKTSDIGALEFSHECGFGCPIADIGIELIQERLQTRFSGYHDS